MPHRVLRRHAIPLIWQLPPKEFHFEWSENCKAPDIWKSDRSAAPSKDAPPPVAFKQTSSPKIGSSNKEALCTCRVRVCVCGWHVQWRVEIEGGTERGGGGVASFQWSFKKPASYISRGNSTKKECLVHGSRGYLNIINLLFSSELDFEHNSIGMTECFSYDNFPVAH